MKQWWLLFAVLVFLTGSSLAQETDENTDPVVTREALPDSSRFELTEVASGFDFPLYVTNAGDGSDRLFVVEQTGRIWIVKDGERLSGPFIDLSDRVSQNVLSGYSERGLLGLAFDPNYAENGEFYVNYTDANGTTHLSRFVVSDDNPNLTDRATETQLLTIEQFAPNHNGGHLAFGPDGYLYMAVGDGGGAGDPTETAQVPSDLLGSILRIDVSNAEDEQSYAIPEDNPYAKDDSFAPEVWAYGLRNPWRFSFDRATGDLYIADVGQNQYEEVNFQPADSSGGENYGWDVFEGLELYEGWMGEPQVETVEPIAVYNHGSGCSVSGGYVYRGAAIPELEAAYLYSDYCSGNIWAAYRDTSDEWHSGIIMQAGTGISSFGEDEAGEVYVLDYSGGRLLKFTPVD